MHQWRALECTVGMGENGNHNEGFERLKEMRECFVVRAKIAPTQIRSVI